MTPEHSYKLERLSSFTVLHPGYSAALETIHRAIDLGDAIGDSCGSILLGDPGTGKSRFCDQLRSEYPAAHFDRLDGDEQQIIPVFYCRVPNDSTVKSLMSGALRLLGAYREYQSLEALEHCLLHNLRKCQTRLLILDEWPHLYRTGTDRAIKDAADFAKTLMDFFQRPILFVGEGQYEYAFNCHAALADRCPYRAALYPFSLASPESRNIFAKVLRAYGQFLNGELGFEEVLPMTDEKMVLAFYAATGGNFRGLSNILKEAVYTALRRNAGDFCTQDLISGCSTIQVSTRLTEKNSFELTIGELKKIIAKNPKGKSL
ncbi:TniB family NTP-binding protein [Pseudomonas sp. OA65]|uniref:TniB family NTP-binding protein n=1 Tax=Pseudomonas sp. OA65 TaxID=2818431 RepID=UPI001A9EDD6A|nr:TniB family NTP-binding protein [Pseudomonas sp. OA65]MBO1541256.1 TniB family NTP-binding protein [Pseudomonas sp. OA65]